MNSRIMNDDLSAHLKILISYRSSVHLKECGWLEIKMNYPITFESNSERKVTTRCCMEWNIIYFMRSYLFPNSWGLLQLVCFHNIFRLYQCNIIDFIDIVSPSNWKVSDDCCFDRIILCYSQNQLQSTSSSFRSNPSSIVSSYTKASEVSARK